MVRRAFNAQKAGHAGTLDPLATGLLAVALGEATKTVPYMMDAEKTYTFTVKWGEETTTCDAEGEVSATSFVRPSQQQIEQTLLDFIGDIEQAPPVYSAIRIDGARAYDLARAGEHVEMAKRHVFVSHLDLLDCSDKDHAIFKVSCGKGTYVRSLARDLAIALDTFGHVSALRRVATGDVTISQCIDIGALENPGQLSCILQPLEVVLDHLIAIELSAEQAVSARHGNPVYLASSWLKKRDEKDVLLTFGGKPVCIASCNGCQARPHRVFNLDESGFESGK